MREKNSLTTPGCMPPGTSVRVGIRLADERDRRHLERIVGMAARRRGMALHCSEVPLAGTDQADTDLLIVRRGEPGSSELLANRQARARPVIVVYTDNPRESHDWRLDWPARADDLIRLLGALEVHLGEHRDARATQESTP